MWVGLLEYLLMLRPHLPPIIWPLVPVGMVVYGFGEAPDASQRLLPTVYLGEYRVTGYT